MVDQFFWLQGGIFGNRTGKLHYGTTLQIAMDDSLLSKFFVPIAKGQNTFEEMHWEGVWGSRQS